MFGRKRKGEKENNKAGVHDKVPQNNIDPNTPSNLHINIPNERVHEISNRYISGAIMEGRRINAGELGELSSSELEVLYTNTDWFLENVIRADEAAASIGRQNQIAFKGAIIRKLKMSPFYVIYTDLTRLPYLFNNALFLIYTDKSKAEQVAAHYTNQFKIPFTTLKVDNSTGDYFALPYVCGLHQFIVDGGKLILVWTKYI